MPRLVLTEEPRACLKKPLGKLLRGDGPEVYRELAEEILRSNPPRVILVGDAVSRNAAMHKVRTDLMIVDNKEMRGPTKAFDRSARRTFLLRNEPGTISADAWAGVEEAVQRGDALMIVDGEEDLLTLVAITVAPLGSIVAYGQPNEGLVIVQVDDQAKERAGRVLCAMAKTD